MRNITGHSGHKAEKVRGYRHGTASAKRSGRRSRNRRGMALLVVVVLVMLVSLAGYRYSFEMENEYRLTRLQEEQVQARLCSQSGIEFAISLLEQPLAIRQSVLKNEALSQVFRREVHQSNALDRTISSGREDHRWQFAILSQTDESSSVSNQGGVASASQSIASATDPLGNTASWKWGFASESGKLHIPTLLRWNQTQPGMARRVLLSLPEADEETVDGWLATLGVRTATTAAQDAMQSAMGGGLQSNVQRQQRTRSLENFRLRWMGGDLDQNYRLDPWEETLMERLLVEPGVGQSAMSPMARELSKVNTTAMGQGLDQGVEGQGPTGWSHYLTWVQGERNERPTGKRRIWLNQPDLRKLHQELSEIMPQTDANFIVAMRQYGPGSNGSAAPTVPGGPALSANGVGATPSSAARASVQRGVSGMGGASANTGGRVGNPNLTGNQGMSDGSGAATGASAKAPGALKMNNSASGQAVGSAAWTPNWQTPGKYQLKSPLELVENTLSIEIVAAGGSTGSESSSASKRTTKQTMASPFNGASSDLKGRISKLLNETTTLDQPMIEGRVDITTASAIVLGAIPGMTQEMAQRIVQSRREGANSQETIQSIGWLVEKGIMDWSKLRELEPYITTRSDVFSLQSVGFRDDRTPVFRSTVLIDARQIPAQVRDVRVWHPWDRGFTTEALTQSVP